MFVLLNGVYEPMTMRIKFGIKHLLGLMIVIGVAIQMILWEPWEEPRYRRNTLAALNRLETKLASALSDPRRASWAGVYCCEDEYYDMTLTIAPNVGWLMERRTSGGCLVYTDFNFGQCTVDKERVRLIASLNEPQSPIVLVIGDSCLDEIANEHSREVRRWDILKTVDDTDTTIQN